MKIGKHKTANLKTGKINKKNEHRTIIKKLNDIKLKWDKNKEH